MRIIRAVNLIGDSLYMLKPLAEFHMQRPQEDVVIGVGGGLAAEIVRRQFQGVMKVEDFGEAANSRDVQPHRIVDLSAGHAAEIAGTQLFRFRRRMHISECYAQILDVDSSGWAGNFRPLTGWAGDRREPVEDHAYIVISPFSASCSRHMHMRANKTPGLDHWGLTIKWLESNGFIPIVLYGPGDEWPYKDGTVNGTTDLDELVMLLTGATAVIAVDNGIGHMASALGCRTVILWPPVSSIHFIAPTWNKTTTLLYLHPERVRADQLCTLVAKELVWV